jgi:hypothetical protein
MRWRETSLRGGWTYPRDWWTAAVDALTEAVCDERDPAPACARLGQSRAQSGVGLAEAIADLSALYSTLDREQAPRPKWTRDRHRPRDVANGRTEGEVPGALVASLAVGWSEVALDPAAIGACEDPLTRLVTLPYLRARLTETYREAERSGASPSATHALVVVATDPVGGSGSGPSPANLVQLNRTMLVAESVRAAFSGGETACMGGRHQVFVLAGRDSELPVRLGSLRTMLDQQLAVAAPARIWVERLPATADAAHALVADLAR